MGTVRKLKDALQADEKLRKLLVRSGRYTVLLDLDEDSIPDISLIDLNQDGNLDAIAFDLTFNGEFNFYMVDHDGNGIPDEISFYRDGEDEPVKAIFGPEVEAMLISKVSQIHELMMAEVFEPDLMMDALDALEMFLVEAYANLEEEGLSIEDGENP